MPTVSELFQGSIAADAIVNNDPNLKPEKSWTPSSRPSGASPTASVRATLFHERTHDALYSQVNVAAGGTVATIQNVDRIRTPASSSPGRRATSSCRGLDLSGSVTYADSTITTRNDKFPASVGKWQPRVPRWRAALLATLRPRRALVGQRRRALLGPQFGQLDNSDPTASPSPASASFLVVDLRAQYRFDRLAAAVGIDNVNDYRYWAFHPYPQRTFHAELRFDL